MSNKEIWNIGVCCSGTDGVEIYRVYGTKEQVIEYIRDLMKREREDKFDDVDECMDGCNVVDVTESAYAYGELYGCNCFDDCHTDYSAYRDTIPVALGDTRNKERELTL